MHSFEACSDAGDFSSYASVTSRPMASQLRRHMRVDRVAKATENVFIDGYCAYIEDIPDSINQSFSTTVVPVFIVLIDNIIKQLKRLALLPLEEGVEV